MKEGPPQENLTIPTDQIEFHEDNLLEHLTRHFNGSPGSQFIRTEFHSPSDVIEVARLLLTIKPQMILKPLQKGHYRGMQVFKTDFKIGYHGLFELTEFTRRYPDKNVLSQFRHDTPYELVKILSGDEEIEVFAYENKDGIRMEPGILVAEAQKGDALVPTNHLTIAVKQDKTGSPYVATIHPGRPVSSIPTPYRQFTLDGTLIHDGFETEAVTRWRQSQLVYLKIPPELNPAA